MSKTNIQTWPLTVSMVKPQLLLNIIDLQRNGHKHKKYKVEKVEDTQEIKMKKENDKNICRVCLKEGSISIFGCEVEDSISKDLNSFGCINVTIEDPHPKHLCQTCYSLLQCAILLRKSAQKSDGLLNNPIEEVTIEPDTLHQGLEEPRCCPSADRRVVTHKEPRTGPKEVCSVPNRISLQSHNQGVPSWQSPLSIYGQSKPALDYTDDNHIDNDAIEKNNLRKSKIQATKHCCKKCGMSFKTLNKLDDHMLSGNHEKKKLVCPYCHKSYRPRYFNNHLKLHTDITAYICHVCGKNFKTHSHFSSHKQSHVNKLPHQCSFCPYKGKSKDLLKMHLRKHTGEHPYQCTECPSKFISKSNLVRHSLTHKGTEFKCNDCDRGFYTKRDLELHLKVDHKGVKEYECKFCGKAFGYRKTMVKHELKVHKRAKLRGGKPPSYLKSERMETQNFVAES